MEPYLFSVQIVRRSDGRLVIVLWFSDGSFTVRPARPADDTRTLAALARNFSDEIGVGVA